MHARILQGRPVGCAIRHRRPSRSSAPRIREAVVARLCAWPVCSLRSRAPLAHLLPVRRLHLLGEVLRAHVLPVRGQHGAARHLLPREGGRRGKAGRSDDASVLHLRPRRHRQRAEAGLPQSRETARRAAPQPSPHTHARAPPAAPSPHPQHPQRQAGRRTHE